MKRIALVIGSYTEYDKLDQCLKSINSGNRERGVTVVLINQGKDGLYRDIIQSVFRHNSHDGDYYICNSPPKNIYQFWNQGVDLSIREIKADVIGILNDDIVLPKGSVKKIVNQLYDNKLGMIWPDWTSGKMPEDIDKTNKKLMSGPDELVKKEMAGFCFFCPTWVYNQVGLFDVRFKIHGGDTDFFYRFLNAGLVARQTNNVRIHHYYSASLNKVRQEVSGVLKQDKSLVKSLYDTVPKLT